MTEFLTIALSLTTLTSVVLFCQLLDMRKLLAVRTESLELADQAKELYRQQVELLREHLSFLRGHIAFLRGETEDEADP